MSKLYTTSIIAFIISILNFSSIFAQDIIFKRNKEEINCKVSEVGINEIKYKQENNPDGPVFVIRKEDVSKIKYANGTETVITDDKYRVNQEQAILDKKNVVKFEIFAPLTGNITFGYERVLKVGTNLEGRVGIIGPHMTGPNDHASGAFIKGGVKFLTGTDIYIDGMRYSHPLKGKYIKLDVTYSAYASSPEYYNNNTGNYANYRTTTNAFSTNICLGKQWILGNALTLDMYGGVGYGISSAKADNVPAGAYTTDKPYYFYSHIGGTKSSPISFSGGFSLGYIF